MSAPHPPTRIANAELMERINFVAEAAKLAGQDEDLAALAQYLGTEADLTAKKGMIRTKPNHTFCKNCKSPLIPPHLARYSVKRDFVAVHCLQCQTVHKIFRTEKESSGPSQVPHWSFVQELQGRNVVTLDHA